MNNPLDRRRFLKLTAAASVGIVANSSVEQKRAVVAAPTPINRTGGPRFRTSLNAYSFNRMLNDQLKGRGKGVSLLELMEFCAEQDFDGIDPTGYFFPGYPKVPADKFVNDLKRRAFELGLGISGTGVRNDFATANKDKR